MRSDIPWNNKTAPVMDSSLTKGLKDHFCPFCGEKLFRGNVSRFNIVCAACNKLVRSDRDIPDDTDQEEKA